MTNANSKETLLLLDIPNSPWKKIATDLFKIDGQNFLLICNYFSQYPIVTEMSYTTSEAITAEIERAVAMFGKPDIIVSDKGPQY